MDTILFVVVALVASAFVLDWTHMAIDDGRTAARAALRRRYELKLIDEEGLARGLRAIDQAA